MWPHPVIFTLRTIGCGLTVMISSALAAPPGGDPSAGAARPQATLTADEVLTIRDGKFRLDGQPFAEISFNKFDLLWQLYDQISSGKTLDDANPMVAAQNRALANLHALGFRTTRVFALPWGPRGPESYADPAKRKFLYAALDKMVELCERHGIGVVWSLALGTFTDTRLDPHQGWSRGEEQVRELIANPNSRGRRLAYQYLDETVARYRLRKAVVMWEISNEVTLNADIGDAKRIYEGERMPTLAQVAVFFDDVAKRIKAADPLRLVNSGGSAMREHQWHLYQGAGWQLDTLEEQFKCFDLLYARSAVGVMDIHHYPNNTAGATLRGDPDGATLLDLTGYLKLAQRVGRPLMIGELGALPMAKTNAKVWQQTPDYFESYAEVTRAKPWVAKTLNGVVEAGVPLSYWWCYQSDRPMDQANPQRMDIELERNPELVAMVVAANRQLKAKLGVAMPAAHEQPVSSSP